MTTIVKTSSAAQFLALVPQLVGFVPHESIVLVLFRRGRSCGALRLDLPQSSVSRVLERVATTAVGILCKVPRVDGVVPVIYTNSPCEGARLPHHEFAALLVRRMEYSGLGVGDALCVAADGWGSYFDGTAQLNGTAQRDGDERALPRDLAELDAAAITPGLVEHARPLSTPAERAHIPRSPAGAQAAFAREYGRVDDLLLRAAREGDLDTDDHRESELGEPVDLVALAEKVIAFSDDEFDEASAARLARFAQGPPARDVFLLTWAWGETFGRYTWALNERHLNGHSLDIDTPGGSALGGLGMPRPDVARIERAIETLREIAGRMPDDTLSPILTMIAWLYWALGHSSVASIVVDRARALDADYGLAELLDSMLAAGWLPEWAFDDESDASRSPHLLAAANE